MIFNIMRMKIVKKKNMRVYLDSHIFFYLESNFVNLFIEGVNAIMDGMIIGKNWLQDIISTDSAAELIPHDFIGSSIIIAFMVLDRRFQTITEKDDNWIDRWHNYKSYDVI